MLFILKTGVQTTYHLSHSLLIISIPDLEADTGHIYKPLFVSAAQEAGFELLYPVKLASRSALSFYGIEDCYGSPWAPDPPCLPAEERFDVVLAIAYSDVSLGITLLTRWMGGTNLWGPMWPRRVKEAVDLGHEGLIRVRDPKRYWGEVKTLIVDSVQGESVDGVIFLGNQGDNEELRRAVRAVVEERGDGQVVAATELVAEECLFVAARGAAVVARKGMVHGFDGCIVPDWCKTDDGDRGEEDPKVKKGSNKAEL
jgi:hypothetical protein